MSLLLILAMAALVFGSRYLFLVRRLPLRLGPRALRFLSFASPAVLTAIWVPLVLVHDDALDTRLANPYLLAALVAIGLALGQRHTLVTVLGSLLAFFCLPQWL